MKFDDSSWGTADMQDQLIASVAHELKTPLTLISGMSSELQTAPADSHLQQKYLERIPAAAQLREIQNGAL